MAKKKTTIKSASTTKKVAKATPATKKTKKAPQVRVKTINEVASTTLNLLSYNLHDRFTFEYSTKTKKKLVAYGPWLATLFVVIISPQLLILAKNGNLITVSGFFNEIFFNQKSWVILVLILLNVLFLVDGLSDLFTRTSRGWNRVYIPALVTLCYTIWQLFANLSQPAAPILAILGSLAVVFTVLDIRSYYN